MAKDVLSHEEIEALVAAAKEGRLPEDSAEKRPKRSRRVRDVDFRRPTKFTQEQQRRLERGHDTFARRATTKLSAELRAEVEIELLDHKQLTWSAALAEVPAGSLLGVVSLEPQGTRVLLTAELEFIMRALELLLGGSGESKVSQRDLTEIESALSARIFEMLVEPLSLAWQEMTDLHLVLVGVETLTPNVQLAPLSDASLSYTFEARVGQSSSTLSLVIPHRSVQSAIAKFGAHAFDEQRPDDRGASAEAMKHALEDVEVEVRAEAGSVALTLAELVALEPGAVVPLARGSHPRLLLGDRPLHRVRPGRSGTVRAIQIVDALEEDR
jgi:flagellar motor switch protein FliM